MTSVKKQTNALKKAVIGLFLLAIAQCHVHAQIGPPPVITVQPLDTSVVYGGTATFSVTAVGAALSYQWYKDGLLILSQTLTGQTRTNLVLTNVASTDTGQYYVAVNNASGTVTSRKASLTIGTNTPPVANNDTYSTSENVPLTIPSAGVLANDADANGLSLTAELLTNTVHGAVSLSTNGSFIYTPNTNYIGADFFAYQASDGYPLLLEQDNSSGNKRELKDGETGSQSFFHGAAGEANYWISKITIYISREPKNSNGSLNVSLGTGINSGAITGSSVNIPQSAITDTSQGNTFLTYDIVFSAPIGPFIAGTTYYLNIDNETGKKVDLGYPNTDSYTNGTFYYNGSDQQRDMRFQLYQPTTSNPATVTINVIHANQPPVGNNDAYTVLEDSPLVISAPGVLTNDTDADGDTLKALLVSTVSHGSLNFSTNGNFTYLPATNYNGNDSFTYRPTDPFSTGSVATVTINITPVNDAPIGSNDTYTTLEDVRLNISSPGVLVNDTDVDGDTLRALLVSTVSHGSLNLNTNGGFTYTPATNYNGVDSFTYRPNDGNTNGNLTTVTITVTPVNDAPLALNDSYTTLEDTRLNVAAPGILVNDSDVEGDSLTAQLASNVTHGTLTLNSDGSFSYLATTNYNGNDSFTYRANDGITNGNLATVTINITPVYDAAVAANDSTNTLEDTSVTVKVLANDYNPDSRTLTITNTYTTNGTAIINGTNVVFTPATNFNGTTVFTYTLFDGSNASTASVTVTVTPVNDPPVASNDSYTMLEDTRLTVAAPGVLANDTDVEGDPLNAQLVSNVTHGVLTFNTNGGFTYLPATNYNGADSFTYRVNDGATNGNLATVTLNITPVYDAAIAVNDSTNTLEDTSVTIKVLGNDYNPDNRTLTFTNISTTNGTAVVSGTNIVFTPATNFNGTAVFTYEIFDGSNVSTATVTVAVTPVNDPPVPADDTYTTLEDMPLTVGAPGVIGNDVDVDGDPLKVWVWNDVSHGSLTLNTNGGFTYKPDTNYNGSDSFTYYEYDGQTFGNNLGTVTINITPVNDAPVAVNDNATTPEDTAVTIKVLANDWDVEGSPLTLVSTVTTNGTAIISNTNVVFTPSTNFNGTVVFNYTVTDGSLYATGKVTVTVNAVNDAPIANNDSYVASENTMLTVPASGILSNDTDTEGSALTALLVTTTSHGSLNLNANGSFTYMPSSNYFGGDSFTYRARDLSSNSAAATVSLTIHDTQTPLQFISTEARTNGFWLTLSEPGGYVCVIEASTNLIDWTPIITNSGISGVTNFMDPAATNMPNRFYRAMAR